MFTPVAFSSFNADVGGGVTLRTSLIVDPTTIIFAPLVTCRSRNDLEPSFTKPK